MIEKNFSQLTLDGCKKEFISVMDSLSYSHNRWQVFCDFVEMSAIAISNTSDMIHYEEREARYKEIMAGYSKMDADKFVDLLSLVMAACRRCEDSPRDILGELFHQMSLQNEWKGQFFTPSHLCSFMAELQMGDIDDNAEFLHPSYILYAKRRQTVFFIYCVQFVMILVFFIDEVWVADAVRIVPGQCDHPDTSIIVIIKIA